MSICAPQGSKPGPTPPSVLVNAPRTFADVFGNDSPFKLTTGKDPKLLLGFIFHMNPEPETPEKSKTHDNESQASPSMCSLNLDQDDDLNFWDDPVDDTTRQVPCSPLSKVKQEPQNQTPSSPTKTEMDGSPPSSPLTELLSDSSSDLPDLGDIVTPHVLSGGNKRPRSETQGTKLSQARKRPRTGLTTRQTRSKVSPEAGAAITGDKTKESAPVADGPAFGTRRKRQGENKDV
jgi:hypothetical protein